MDNVYGKLRSMDTQNNRWIAPVGAIILGVLVIGLAAMFVAPMFRKDTLHELEERGRGIKKRSGKRASSAVKQIKNAVENVVEDVTETVQDQAAKVKRTARKKIQ